MEEDFGKAKVSTNDKEYMDYIKNGEAAVVYIVRDLVNEINTEILFTPKSLNMKANWSIKKKSNSF